MGTSGRRGEREARLRSEGVVRLRCGGRVGVHTGFLRDLSRGGMFLRLVDPEEAGTHLGFELSLPGRSQRVRGTGEVAWARSRYEGPGLPGGMAVRFVTLEVDGARELTDLLGAPPRAGVQLVANAVLPGVGESSGGLGDGAPRHGRDEDAAPKVDRVPGVGHSPEGLAGEGKPTRANDDGGTMLPAPEPAGSTSGRSGRDEARPLGIAVSAPAAGEVQPVDSELGGTAGQVGTGDDQGTNAGSRHGSRRRSRRPALLWVSAAAVLLVVIVWAGWRGELGRIRGAVVQPTEPGSGDEAAAAGDTAPDADAADTPQLPGAIAGGGAAAGAPAAASAAGPAPGAAAPADREPLATTPARRLTGVRWEVLPAGGTRLVLAFDGMLAEERVRSSAIGGDAPRLVLQLAGLQAAAPGAPWRPATPEVAAVRTGFHPSAGGGALHVVLDLADPAVELAGLEIGGGELHCDLRSP